MFCGNCGKEIADDSKVCAYCGTPVQSEGQPYNMVQLSNKQHYGEQPNGGAGLAIASMVLGILALVLSCCLYYVSLPCAVAGIICAAISMKGNRAGKGMAIAGLVCSIVSLVLAVILMASEAVMSDFTNELLYLLS